MRYDANDPKSLPGDRYRVVINDDRPAFPYTVTDTERRNALGDPAIVLETDDLLHAYQHADTLNGWGIWPAVEM